MPCPGSSELKTSNNLSEMVANDTLFPSLKKRKKGNFQDLFFLRIEMMAWKEPLYWSSVRGFPEIQRTLPAWACCGSWLPAKRFCRDNVNDALFLSSSFHWHLSAKCPGRVAMPARAGASTYLGWGKAGKPPARKSPARRISSELGPHSNLKAGTRLPWRRPESSLTQLKSLSWKPFLKDYRFNTFRYKQQPCRQGQEAEQSYVAWRILEELW